MITDEAAHDQAVRERWKQIESDGRLARVIAIIDERARAIKARHHRRLNAVLNHPTMTLDAKLEAAWEAVDEIGAVAKPYAACSRGCSHCCHVSVLMSQQEADLIGRRIRVKPLKKTGITRRGDIESGYHNPCPFLKDSACSIYASRPLACRQQFNMDRDALLCELVGDKATKVPYLNMLDYQSAIAMMTLDRRESIQRDPRTGHPVPCTVETSPDVGDIREFFPRGRG